MFPGKWADKYKGKFDEDYEKARLDILERQKQKGIIPEDADLSPMNPLVNENKRRRKSMAAARRSTPLGFH